MQPNHKSSPIVDELLTKLRTVQCLDVTGQFLYKNSMCSISEAYLEFREWTSGFFTPFENLLLDTWLYYKNRYM